MSDGIKLFCQVLEAIKTAEEQAHKAHELIAKLPGFGTQSPSLRRAWVKSNDAEERLIVARMIADQALEDYEFAVGKSSLVSNSAQRNDRGSA